jgi:hypothetical protein
MAERAPYLYIVNSGRPTGIEADVSVCVISGQTLGGCKEAVAVTFTTGPTTYSFDAPQALAFFNGDYALVTSSGGNAIVLCTMDTLDAPALLSNCAITASGFNVPADIVIVSPS